MSKGKLFDDGSSIEWIDKETLKYTDNGYSVSIWVDYEPGFLNNDRIIKSSSLLHWEVKPDEMPNVIDEKKRIEIIEKIKQYYNAKGIKCRVE